LSTRCTVASRTPGRRLQHAVDGGGRHLRRTGDVDHARAPCIGGCVAVQKEVKGYPAYIKNHQKPSLTPDDASFYLRCGSNPMMHQIASAAFRRSWRQDMTSLTRRSALRTLSALPAAGIVSALPRIARAAEFS
jgi:hypothetical protein